MFVGFVVLFGLLKVCFGVSGIIMKGVVCEIRFMVLKCWLLIISNCLSMLFILVEISIFCIGLLFGVWVLL